MENKEKHDLIVLEQLPIIKTYFENLKLEIQEKVDNVSNLVVNEDNYKEIKKVRADLNKEFGNYETQRKQVKNAVLGKYNEFENIYKENVADLYQEADKLLKGKIDNVTQELLNQKREELVEFANQHIEYNHLENILKFEDIPLNITLSASMKSLKEEIVNFVKKVCDDFNCIPSDENRDELVYEYTHNGFNYTNAVLTIRKRHEELERIKQQQEKVEEIKQEEQKVAEKVEEVIQEITPPKPIIEDEEIIKVSFTITTTKEKIIKLKNFLESENIEYD